MQENKQENNRLKYALAYAEKGWPVMPVHYIDRGRCSCPDPMCGFGDKKNQAGKHPATINGIKNATTNPDVIKQWFKEGKYNIGIRCTKFQVFDIDPRNGGDKTWTDFISGKNLAETCIANTGGGGFHYLFKVPQGKRLAKPGDGIDIKSGGGYIVVEPSSHVSGGYYSWEGEFDPLDGQEIAVAADWMLIDDSPAIESVSSGNGFLLDSEKDDILDALKYLDPSCDYQDWFKIGAALHSTGAKEAFSIWDNWSAEGSNYQQGCTAKQWEKFGKGKSFVNIETLYFEAAKCGWTFNVNKKQEEQKSMSPFFVDAKKIESKPAQWLINNYFEKDNLTCIFGDPASGKSFIAIDLALCVATGSAWCGNPVEKGKVIYIAGEGKNGLKRRTDAWLKYHNRTLEDSSLFFSTGAALLKDKQNAEYVMNQINDICEDSPPTLIVIDTLARNMGGDENSTSEMNEFIHNLDKYIREPYKACLIVVHHTGHADKTRARGAMSFKGALDSEYRLRKDEDGNSFFSCTKMKEYQPPEALELIFETVETETGDSAVLVPTFNFSAFEALTKEKQEKWNFFVSAWQEFKCRNQDGYAYMPSRFLSEYSTTQTEKTWPTEEARRKWIARLITTLEEERIIHKKKENLVVIKEDYNLKIGEQQ